MAKGKGTRAGQLALRTIAIQDRLAEMVSRKEKAGYYSRPRPVRKPVKHFIRLANGVVRRVAT